MGRLRVDFVPARDAYHGRGVRALAGPADLERALRGRGRCRRARLARRHHLAERRILGTGRRLFALRLARHRPAVWHGRERGALDPKSCYTCWMVRTPFFREERLERTVEQRLRNTPVRAA